MVLGSLLRFRRHRAAHPTTTPTPATRGEEIEQETTREKLLLLKLEDLPVWSDPNPYITTAYRVPSNNFLSCLCSCYTHLHNETCNIYTHLIPALVILTLRGSLHSYLVSQYGEKLTSFDWAVLSAQLFGAVTCFLCSAGYHTFLNHSEYVAEMWLKIDFIGILSLMWGEFVSGLHFGLYCYDELKWFYWGVVTLLSTIDGIILLSPTFRGPEYKYFRLWSLILTGLFAFAPIGHVYLLGGKKHLLDMGVPYYLLEGLSLGAGVVFWERQFPEKFFPGRFDIYGGSHSIWHVFVVLSVLAHWGGLFRGVDSSYTSGCS